VVCAAARQYRIAHGAFVVAVEASSLNTDEPLRCFNTPPALIVRAHSGADEQKVSKPEPRVQCGASRRVGADAAQSVETSPLIQSSRAENPILFSICRRTSLAPGALGERQRAGSCVGLMAPQASSSLP
jgi:hypothetical protein